MGLDHTMLRVLVHVLNFFFFSSNSIIEMSPLSA